MACWYIFLAGRLNSLSGIPSVIPRRLTINYLESINRPLVNAISTVTIVFVAEYVVNDIGPYDNQENEGVRSRKPDSTASLEHNGMLVASGMDLVPCLGTGQKHFTPGPIATTLESGRGKMYQSRTPTS